VSESGALTFARFAYPPNALGYCGPDASRELLERADERTADARLRELAMGFEGAWPYLELIAHEHGVADPLDARVVEAYWIGNALLDGVRLGALADSSEPRNRGAVGRDRARLAEVVEASPRPHHDFQVFCVYPWVSRLRTSAVDTALHVLDRCRVRWGRVLELAGPTAIVRSRPLTWDGRELGLGAPREEAVTIAESGYRLDRAIGAGDQVALHWDWACTRLTDRQVRALRRETARQLAFANRLRVPPPHAVAAPIG
jgi:Family of unknown function (DUF6390)